MAETQTSKSETKRERQPISVPFVWEEKPGTPKKDWNPTRQPIIKTAPPPPKFVVSVPLKWEEKPGTPLPFAQHPKQNIFFSSPPTTYSDHDYEEDGSSDSEEGEIETWNYETDDDSFTSAKSLLANALIPTNALANAVPVEVNSPGSPASEAESCTSSYASGTTGLVGASFLEWLFPLLVQNSGSQDKERCVEKAPSCNDMENMEFLHERNYSQVRRKPLLTLGELILMSRRRSCQRKVMRMHKQPSMDLMKGNAFGCCIGGAGNSISGFHLKWKKQLQLKLM